MTRRRLVWPLCNRLPCCVGCGQSNRAETHGAGRDGSPSASCSIFPCFAPSAFRQLTTLLLAYSTTSLPDKPTIRYFVTALLEHFTNCRCHFVVVVLFVRFAAVKPNEYLFSLPYALEVWQRSNTQIYVFAMICVVVAGVYCTGSGGCTHAGCKVV